MAKCYANTIVEITNKFYYYISIPVEVTDEEAKNLNSLERDLTPQERSLVMDLAETDYYMDVDYVDYDCIEISAVEYDNKEKICSIHS